tara:strand:- start:246 stop:401 length:156 start_codon:yes stop_codon:yes gene_type:complete
MLSGVHAKDPDLCRWVVKNFKGRDTYKGHRTVEEWVENSEKILEKEKLSAS